MKGRCTCARDGEPCDYCQRRIDRAQLEREFPGDDRVDELERNYEKWLDTIGGSRC